MSRRANIQQVCFAAVTQTMEKQHLGSTPTLGGATKAELVSSEGCFSGRGKQDGEGSLTVAGMNRHSSWTHNANYRLGFPHPVFKAHFGVSNQKREMETPKFGGGDNLIHKTFFYKVVFLLSKHANWEMEIHLSSTL